MQEEKWDKAASANVVKFESKGDSLVGELISVEESAMYAGSYAVKVKEGNETKVVFTNNIVPDLIESSQIKPGDRVAIKYMGKKKNQKGNYSYNDYEVLFKKK